MQKNDKIGGMSFDLKKKKKKNEGWKKKRTIEGKERNVEKKSKFVNCQVRISFVLWPSSLEQLSS